MKRDEVIEVLPLRFRNMAAREFPKIEHLQEIRLRIGKPLLCYYRGREHMIMQEHGQPVIVSHEDIQEMLDYVSHYSLYAYEGDMRQGFITIRGGHRVGLTGQVIMEGGRVKNLRNISSVNLRISHEQTGCGAKVFPYITKGHSVYHTLILSPPGCGKTTLLRDLIRQISEGTHRMKGMSVGVVDERSEIGGCYKGVPQNQLGMRTDILDGCPKAEGMLMLIRSMNPKVIAVDEIGLEEDVHAIAYAMHCGCKLLATAHAESLAELQEKPLLKEMLEQEQFERYVVLTNRKHIGQIEGIYDSKGLVLFREGI